MTREGGGRHELFISLSIASLRAKALNLVLFLVLYHLLRDPLFWLGIIPSITDNLLQRIEEPTQGWIAGKLSGHPIKNCLTSQSKTTISGLCSGDIGTGCLVVRLCNLSTHWVQIYTEHQLVNYARSFLVQRISLSIEEEKSANVMGTWPSSQIFEEMFFSSLYVVFKSLKLYYNKI